MVFVHGGGFLIHSAANYGDYNIAKNLCLHDVIVCVVQYRLGMLGFLSTGDSHCPGNWGLWDQLEAIKWIKEHARLFGGDPNNITPFGQSAGAASVDLLSVSPHSRGLFSRCILMGGNANSHWSMSTPEKTLRAAVRAAKKSGWEGATNDGDGDGDGEAGEEVDCEALLAFLRTLPSEQLRAPLVGKSAFNQLKRGLEFCPVIDGDLLPRPLEELRRQAPALSIIIGTADCEALLFHALGRAQSDMRSIDKFLQLHIPETVGRRCGQLREDAKQLYLAGLDPTHKEDVSRAFLRLYSDILMNNCTARFCQQMVEAGHTVRLYNMTYYNRDGFGFFGFRMPFLAATHCHDLRYVLGRGLYAKFRPNYDDLRVVDIMTTLWSNFAKYGDPNGCAGTAAPSSSPISCQWEALTPANTYLHLDINLELTMHPDYQDRRWTFWERLEHMTKEKDEDITDIDINGQHNGNALIPNK